MRLRFIVLACMLVIASLGAASAQTYNTINEPLTPRVPKAQIVNASGTGNIALYTGATRGTKVTGLWCVSTDTADRDVTVSILRSAVTYPQTTVTVKAGSGMNGATPTTNMFAPTPFQGPPKDATGSSTLFLESTDTLQISAVTTVTAARTISCTAIASDFL